MSLITSLCSAFHKMNSRSDNSNWRQPSATCADSTKTKIPQKRTTPKTDGRFNINKNISPIAIRNSIHPVRSKSGSTTQSNTQSNMQIAQITQPNTQIAHTTFCLDRVSLGIACCRFSGNKPEILLVCKRFTYAYNLFAHGKYNSSNNAELMALFNGMTIEEKHDLLSLNFMQIWYRLWLNSTQKNANYFNAKNKFESTFMVDSGVRLRKLISKSTHSNKIWEIPKGRKKNKTEPDIHCAIREFGEETGVTKKSYKIYPTTRTYSYVDDGVRYTNIYYLAFTKYNIDPHISFNLQDQVDEISDIRWMDIEDIRRIDESKRLESFVTPIFNFMKKHAK